MFRYKIDVMAALKEAGYSTYVIRKNKIFGQASIQKIISGSMPSWGMLNTICGLLNCQPGDIFEYVPDELSGSD